MRRCSPRWAGARWSTSPSARDSPWRVTLPGQRHGLISVELDRLGEVKVIASLVLSPPVPRQDVTLIHRRWRPPASGCRPGLSVHLGPRWGTARSQTLAGAAFRAKATTGIEPV